MFLSLFVLTNDMLANNARGESAGNATTLQKVSTPYGSATVLSGPAIRYAIREAMLNDGEGRMWRTHGTANTPSGYGYGPKHEGYQKDAPPKDTDDYDDVRAFGYMFTSGSGSGATRRVSALYVSDALSVTPFVGDRFFGQGVGETNLSEGDEGAVEEKKAKAKADKPAQVKERASKMMPIAGERHFTRYGFYITFNLREFGDRPAAVLRILRAMDSLKVGGNHAAHSSELCPGAGVVVARLHKTPGCQLGGLLPQSDVPYTTPEEFLEFAQKRLAGYDYQIFGDAVGKGNWNQVLAWAEKTLTPDVFGAA